MYMFMPTEIFHIPYNIIANYIRILNYSEIGIFAVVLNNALIYSFLLFIKGNRTIDKYKIEYQFEADHKVLVCFCMWKMQLDDMNIRIRHSDK